MHEKIKLLEAEYFLNQMNEGVNGSKEGILNAWCFGFSQIS